MLKINVKDWKGEREVHLKRKLILITKAEYCKMKEKVNNIKHRHIQLVSS